jgi:predicted phosphodiesterase
MRIGLLADIHSHFRELEVALAILRVQGLDSIITLGDSIDAFGCPEKAGITAELLLENRVVGVWGNHDMSLCIEPNPSLRARFPAPVFEFSKSLMPSIGGEDLWIAHREPSINPMDAQAMWSLPPEDFNLEDLAAEQLAVHPDRFMMIGHYHRWFAAKPGGALEWIGDKPLTFSSRRSIFLTIAPVFDGFCAVLDIQKGSKGETLTLEPYQFTILPE